MNDRQNEINVIIAGATGLVGQHVLEQALHHERIHTVYSLSRQPAQPKHDPDLKLVHLISEDLSLPSWSAQQAVPSVGYICLGTTKKQAGSQAALEAVDLDLVTEVAQTMLRIGVNKLAVVSSYGANPHSPAHYLRCKGKMEQRLSQMGFEQVVFARPGPLKGNRQQPRWDEKVVQSVLGLIHPLMIGSLKNLLPIEADDVARCLLQRTLASNPKSLEYINREEMLTLLAQATPRY